MGDLTNTLETLSFLPLPHYEEKTIPEFVLARVAERNHAASDIWMTHGGTGAQYKYAEFDEMSRKVASALFKRGMRKGDSVIYMTSEIARLQIFMMGVWRANGFIRASYAEDLEETILDRVRESGSKWILCDATSAQMCLSVSRTVTSHNVEVIVVGRVEGCLTFDELFEDDGKSIPNLEVEPEDIAIIFCTSGTTGKSKGASHSHRNTVEMMRNLTQWFPFVTDAPNLLVTRGTHIGGALTPLSNLAGGKPNLVVAPVTKDTMVSAIVTHKPKTIFAFAPFVLMLKQVEKDIPSLECAITVGGIVTPSMRDAILSIGNIKRWFQGYGMTEHIFVAGSYNYEDPSGEPVQCPDFSIGRVVPGTKVQIRDPTTLLPVGPGVRGDLCSKSDMLFAGYLGNDEATRDAYIDGYLRSGDLAYYDEKGFIYVVDRLKEIFKYFNNHISPTEIEEIVNQHPAVAEVCVVGIPAEDGGGHIPRAFVTLKQGVEPNGIENDIRDYANAQLASYKQIKAGVYIVSSLPKGNTGKVSRILAAKLPV